MDFILKKDKKFWQGEIRNKNLMEIEPYHTINIRLLRRIPYEVKRTSSHSGCYPSNRYNLPNPLKENFCRSSAARY